MKVLSIKQPWASLIVLGVKRFEIRSWSTDYRGPLLIHASSSAPTATLFNDIEHWGMLPLLERVGFDSLAALKALPRSAVVGRVMLDDIWTAEQLRTRATHDDAVITGLPDKEQSYWKLNDPAAIDPVEDIKGKLNLWALDEADGRRVDRALKRARAADFRGTPSGRKPANWSALESQDHDESGEAPSLLLKPRPLLAAIIGIAARPQDAIVKAVWDYVVAHGLQHRTNPKLIRADARLEALSGADTIRLFDLPKYIAKHVDVID